MKHFVTIKKNIKQFLLKIEHLHLQLMNYKQLLQNMFIVENYIHKNNKLKFNKF